MKPLSTMDDKLFRNLFPNSDYYMSSKTGKNLIT